MIGFIPFPRLLVLCEMQSVSSRIWPRIAVFISCDDNHYTTSSFSVALHIKLLKNYEKYSKIFLLHTDPWPSRQSDVLSTGRTREKKAEAVTCWTEIEDVMKWYMQVPMWESQSESQSISASSQPSVESADREPQLQRAKRLSGVDRLSMPCQRRGRKVLTITQND